MMYRWPIQMSRRQDLVVSLFELYIISDKWVIHQYRVAVLTIFNAYSTPFMTIRNTTSCSPLPSSRKYWMISSWWTNRRNFDWESYDIVFGFCSSSFERKMSTILLFISFSRTFSCFSCIFITISELWIAMIEGYVLTEAQVVAISSLSRERIHQKKNTSKGKESHSKRRIYRKTEHTERENADIELTKRCK